MVNMSALRMLVEAAQARDSPAPRFANSCLMPCYLNGAFDGLSEV